MTDKEIELAKRLVGLDGDHECPLCEKVDWGAIHHADDCPFAMAYAILDDLDDETRKRLLPEANKMSLRWIHVVDGIDEYATATRSTLGWQSHFKLQTLADGKWHDVEYYPEGGEGG